MDTTGALVVILIVIIAGALATRARNKKKPK